MKKSIFSIAALLSVFLIFGCANSSGDDSSSSPSGGDVPISEMTFDFRIKKTSGTQNASRALQAEGDGKLYEVTEPFINFKNELNLSEEVVKGLFTLQADEEKGIKITFHKDKVQLTGDKAEYVYDMFNVTYMDKNKNYSSRMNYYTWRDKGNERTEFYYPLVRPNSLGVGLSVAVLYKNPNENDVQYEVSSLYVLDTLGGLGCVDDLPEGANDDTSHILIDNLTATVKNVIPPDNMGGIAKNMKKAHCLYFTDGTDLETRWEQNIGFGYKYEEMSTEEALTIDLNLSFNPCQKDERKNMYVQLVYAFSIDGYDGVEFLTPELISTFEPLSSVNYDINKLGYWDHEADDNENDATTEFNPVDGGISFTKGNDVIYASGNGVNFTISDENDASIEKTGISKHFYTASGKNYRISFKKSTGVNAQGFWFYKSEKWKGFGTGPEDIGTLTKNEDDLYSISFTALANEEVKIKFNGNAAGTYSITDFKLEEVE